MSADRPPTVKKIAYTIPVSCCLAGSNGLDGVCDHVSPPITRRTRLGWWLQDRWNRRPRIHFGPCNHEDCW